MVAIISGQLWPRRWLPPCINRRSTLASPVLELPVLTSYCLCCLAHGNGARRGKHTFRMASSAGNAGVRQPLKMFDAGRHHIHCSGFILGSMLPRAPVSAQITQRKKMKNEKRLSQHIRPERHVVENNSISLSAMHNPALRPAHEQRHHHSSPALLKRGCSM
jgi:hypothetical protein